MSEVSESDRRWEAAYLRFRTPQEEDREFEGALAGVGAGEWPRAARIVELFCGRGGGLRVLSRLGFSELHGVDLSPRLLAEYAGPGRVWAADCRELPFADASVDVVLARDGLHHLPDFPGDLDRAFGEVHRVLRDGGRFVVIEPWLTPYLRALHALCATRWLRRLWPKLDALGVMVDIERPVYFRWLENPGAVEERLTRWFDASLHRVRMGQLRFVGHKRI